MCRAAISSLRCVMVYALFAAIQFFANFLVAPPAHAAAEVSEQTVITEPAAVAFHTLCSDCNPVTSISTVVAK
jgi:hypothetical protein